MSTLITAIGRAANTGAALVHGRSAGTADATGWPALAFYLVVAGTGAAYGRGVHELWHRRGVGAVIGRWRSAAFAVGLVVLAAAESPPLHAAVDRSFRDHMVQHMVFLVVVGPLLAAGGAGVALVLAVPRRLRHAAGRVRGGRLSRWSRRPARRAIIAWTLWTVALWFWHLPGPYLAAVHHDTLHAAEHLCFLAASWLLWSCVWGADRNRPGAPTGMLLVFAAGVPATALGVVLAVAPPLYPQEVLAATGGDAAGVQHLAGVLMWAPMEATVIAAAVTLFVRWLMQLERRMPGDRDLRPVADPPGITTNDSVGCGRRSLDDVASKRASS